ncbi:uncharacterized protein LOC129002804 [Macrosteles quadrilineatus]|uniref:uncharacterized protein LOC129002804 n=1 Tax=Macrosteles quadrilineatus TaxID=74068 RepID=UPI0023E1F95A|nr:uncharacterized protein LOC129002804 [Macrosteles quadrilineatus]
MHKIESASNKCAAAWGVIRSQSATPKSTGTLVDPDVFNSHFIDSVQVARDGIGASEASPQELLHPAPTAAGCLRTWRLVDPDHVAKVVGNMKNTSKARNQSQKTFQTSVRNLLLAHRLFSVQEFYKIPNHYIMHQRCPLITTMSLEMLW